MAWIRRGPPAKPSKRAFKKGVQGGRKVVTRRLMAAGRAGRRKGT